MQNELERARALTSALTVPILIPFPISQISMTIISGVLCILIRPCRVLGDREAFADFLRLLEKLELGY